MQSSGSSSFLSYTNILSCLESFYNSQLFLPKLSYQITKKKSFQRNILISNIVRSSLLIKASNSNLSSNFLNYFSHFQEKSNKAFRANSNQESDMLEVVANKAFLVKNLKGKLDLENNFYVDLKSKDDNNDNNSIVISLQNSQKFKKPIYIIKYLRKANLDFE